MSLSFIIILNHFKKNLLLSDFTCFRFQFGPILYCDFMETSFRERALASVRTFVYSNHKTFGINVVSRKSKYSESFLKMNTKSY